MIINEEFGQLMHVFKFVFIGTDMTYCEKLLKQHLGKSKAIGKVKKQGKFEAHFEIHHYAGTVAYNVTDWLTKNKDPLNGSVVRLYKQSSNVQFQDIWKTYVSAEDAAAQSKGNGSTLKNFLVYIFSKVDII